ncbi:Crystal protein ET79 [Streptomyces sp. NPDC048258]|uniref:Crystal protein ET79 n=1 Tax=Streptomyces sp. NPDC048258 TaxID=3365527 RepID=UPI00371EC141
MPMLSHVRTSARWATSAALLAAVASGATVLAPAAQAVTAQAVTAEADATTSGGATVQSSERSTSVVFYNNTGRQLQRTGSGLDHGCWSRDGLPPDAIAKTVTASWSSESCGFATGTQGHTSYKIAGTSMEVMLRWNNPYVGSNSYRCDAPDGYACERSGGGGNNATVNFTLTEKNTARLANLAQAGTAAVTPVRSTRVTVVNQSGALLARTGAGLDHGIWSGDQLPPSTINNGDWARWKSESDGFATGTEGSAEYQMSGGGKVVFRWDNPFAGSNSYSCQVPGGHTCAQSGGGGKNAEVVFTVG